jgi:thiosulfate/3-mercaptopyruvate sulfurtransferase
VHPLVSGDWLAAHLDEVVVVDLRPAWAEGHLPGARPLSLDDDLAGPATAADGRHPLPTPERFAAALGRIGVATGTPVVVCDGAGGSIAARLWWMLHVLGEPVAVLDGGIEAWPGGRTAEVATWAPVDRAPVPWSAGRFVDADHAQAADVLLDARAAGRFTGEAPDPVLDPRPGHVPGARSAAWQGNLDPATGRFLPAADLRRRFQSLGVEAATEVVAYCGSGVTACHDLLALELAGLGTTLLYTGSWSQWGADPSRPAALGPD